MSQTPAPILPTVPPDGQEAPTLPPTLNDLAATALQKVGEYKILGVLGSGGMGIVYKAFDQNLGRVVALKMLHTDLETGAEEMIRFRGEAETLGSLQHPHIVQVFDFGMYESAPYLVMEFVNGGSLDKKLLGQPQVPRRAAELIEQLARAIHAAHEKGIIHRDLKPGNILLTPQGAPKVTDFGLAKRLDVGSGLTQTGAVMGTPSYMAPEQAQGKKDVGPAADIYSLGAILYEMLTGRPPFRGATLQETLEQVCMADPAPPSRLVPRLPRDLGTICMKCLHKTPARRYETAAELADDLKRWQDDLPIHARPTHSVERMFRAIARRPLRALLVLCAAAIVGLMAVVVVMWREQRLEQERTQLQVAADEAIKQQKQQEKDRDRMAENLRFVLGVLSKDQSTPEGLEQLFSHVEEYCKKLEKAHEDESTTSLEAPAEAFFQLAERIRGEGGNPRRAREVLDRAIKLARRDAERTDVAAQYRLAKMLVERGQACYDLRDDDAARKDYDEALKLLETPSPSATEREAVLRWRGEALHQLAALLSRSPSTRREALKRYDEALKVRRPFGEARNARLDDRARLARTLGWMGDVVLEQRDYRKADLCYWESHRLREAISKENPRDYKQQFQLARSWGNFARAQTRLGNQTSALYFHDKARAILQEIHKRQLDNKEYASELVDVLNQIVELELHIAGTDAGRNADRLARAGNWLLEAEAILKELAEPGPPTPGVRSSQAENFAQKARWLLLLHRNDEATKALNEADERLSQGKSDQPNDHYARAAVLAMRAELTPSDARLIDQALQALQLALSRKFTRITLDDVAADRAFAAIAKRPAFVSMIEEHRAAGVPKTK